MAAVPTVGCATCALSPWMILLASSAFAEERPLYFTRPLKAGRDVSGPVAAGAER